MRFGVVEVERVRRHVAGVVRRACRDPGRECARCAEHQPRSVAQAVVRARHDAGRGDGQGDVLAGATAPADEAIDRCHSGSPLRARWRSVHRFRVR